MSEKDILDAIRHTAEMLTSIRAQLAEDNLHTWVTDIDTLRMLEQQTWSAWIMATYGRLKQEANP